MRGARRTTQVAFLLIFLWLLVNTFYHGIVEEEGVISDSLPYPVSIFLHIDPLVAVSSFLATGTIYSDLLWSLLIIIPTLFLGRWFCGWVCPFGTIHNFFSESFKKRKGIKIKRNRGGRHQRIKYVVLVLLLGSALAGTLLVGLLDPLCFLIRSLGLSLLPATDIGARGAVDLLPAGSAAAEGLHRFLDAYFLGPKAHRYYVGWFIGALFILVVALNFYMSRFWCRVVCPLGALLGVLSRFSLFGLHKDEKVCNDCNLCLEACQGGASPEGRVKWKAAECFLCYNCTTECPEGGLEFKFGIQTETTDSTVDLSRRGLIGSLSMGVVALPLIRAARDPETDLMPEAIRPPGSCGEEEFLERCIKCGQCMKVCPNNAIHPAVAQAGFEGFWSPVIIPRIGYCEPTCTLCSKVCPTGAIRLFTEEDKKANRVRIGTAFFDRGRCLPWAMGKNCVVCEEFCPTSPKSIWFEKSTFRRPDGTVLEVNLPRVDPSLCNGCGVCEHVCPVADQAAVRITSVGESRSRRNRILLREGPVESAESPGREGA
jgi:polyferredoxin